MDGGSVCYLGSGSLYGLWFRLDTRNTDLRTGMLKPLSLRKSQLREVPLYLIIAIRILPDQGHMANILKESVIPFDFG